MTFTCTLPYFAYCYAWPPKFALLFIRLLVNHNNIRPIPRSCAIEKGEYETLSINIPVSDITQLLLCMCVRMYSSSLLAQTLANAVEHLYSG